MLSTIIVGAIFFIIIGFGAYKTWKSMRSNSCPGCSGGCSSQERKSCKHS